MRNVWLESSYSLSIKKDEFEALCPIPLASFNNLSFTGELHPNYIFLNFILIGLE